MRLSICRQLAIAAIFWASTVVVTVEDTNAAPAGNENSPEAEVDAAQNVSPGEPDGLEFDGGVSPILGMTLATISGSGRELLSVGEHVEGVLVTSVAASSPADKRFIEPGAVILEAQETAVSEPYEVYELVEDAKAQGLRTVLLLVAEGDDVRFVTLDLGD